MDNLDQTYAGRRRTRRGNRRNAGRDTAAAGGRIDGQPGGQLGGLAGWQDIQTNLPPLTPLSADQLEAVHQASLQLLEEYGIEVMSADVRARFRAAGADVDEASMIVRADRGLILAAIASAPPVFRLTPTNPQRALTVGGRHIHFGMVSGAPNVHDIAGGRRSGNFEDYKKLIKLGQSFNILHFFGNQTLAPNDLPVSTRHLDTVFANLTLSDKIFMSMSIGAERVRDTAALTAIARGISLDEMADDPSSITNININSPRKLDVEMAAAAIAMAEMGQAVVVTPFTLMGAMTPVTLAAALTQQNAEALFAIALTQLARPGAPVVYGGFTSNVDMKTGAPAFGTPEFVRAMQISGQLARFYGLPLRASNANAANALDAQAVWESAFSLQGSCSGGANLIYHAAGWMEGGLSASFEKFVIDCEMLQQIIYTQRPIQVDASTLAVDEIAEVGPHGHFFGCDHTQQRYCDAFYTPLLSDWRNYETWLDDGGLWAHQRAATQCKTVLKEYVEPPMDSSSREELVDFVDRRKADGGAETEFLLSKK